MFGPGESVPDPTEGITDVKDLPPPTIVWRSSNHEREPCPQCGHQAYRHKHGQRTLHDLGDLYSGCPIALLVTYSHHDCSKCRKYCNAALSALAPPGSHDTHRVIQRAVRLVVEDSVPSRPASWHRWRDHRVCVPFSPIPNWGEAGGKKGPGRHGWSVAGLGSGAICGLCRRRCARRRPLLRALGRRQSAVETDAV
jgi:hypothetical protein